MPVANRRRVEKNNGLGRREPPMSPRSPNANQPAAAASTQGTRAPERGRQKGGLLFWLVMTALGLIGIGLFGLAAVLCGGSHAGQEFSPDTFRSRMFYYWAIPYTGIQVWPVTRLDTTDLLSSSLTSGKNPYVKPQNAKSPQWDLVADNWQNTANPEPRYDARILTAYLQMYSDSGVLVWQQWTDDNPQAARVLWPAIADVARRGLYVFVPELMEAAAAETNAQRLKSRLNEILARRYADSGDARQKLGNHERAVELYTEAIAAGGGSARLYRRRAESYASLGQHEEAAADLKEAHELERAEPAERAE
jgi:hypothetical protein